MGPGWTALVPARGETVVGATDSLGGPIEQMCACGSHEEGGFLGEQSKVPGSGQY